MAKDHSRNPPPKKPGTRADYQELHFWLWACLHDAEAFLQAHRKTAHPISPILKANPHADIPKIVQAMRDAKPLAELEKYHFVTTMGTLLRVLKRAQHSFPTIQPHYSRANHLINEGKTLRDMIEHAPDEYLQGGGRNKDEFIKEVSVGPAFPGDRGGAADATAVIVDSSGHWLGGRLCVERVIAELQPIWEEIKWLPEPEPELPNLPRRP
jgi:hypothetical protein